MNLLDTDTFSDYLRGKEPITSRVNASDDVAITIITRLEILKGRIASVFTAENETKVLEAVHWLNENEEAMAAFDVVSFDAPASEQFQSLLKNKAVKKRQLGRGDLLIASIALARRDTVITKNAKHFGLIPNLTIADWSK